MSDSKIIPANIKIIPSTILPAHYHKKSKTIDSVYDLAEKIFEGYELIVKPIQKLMVFQNIIRVINIPKAIIEIVKNRSVLKEKNKEKQIDEGLEICNNVRIIGETSAAFMVALSTYEFISWSFEALAKPFTAVISFLSIASIITQYRTCVKVHKFMQALNKSNECKEIAELIKQQQAEDPSFISNTFHITEKKFEDVVSKIDNPKIDQKVAKGLKQRVKKEFISAIVGLVAATVSLIGTVILLALTSTVIGWIVLGASTGVDIEQFIYHKVIEYQFAKALNLKRSLWEWVTC